MPIRSGGTAPSALPRVRFFALTVFLWLSLIRLPLTPSLLVDPSWQSVLIRAHTQGWQFGREIMFTYGPWGFLTSAHHLGREGAAALLVWEFAGQLGLALGFVALIFEIAAWRQWLFVGAVAIFHGDEYIGIDPAYLSFVVLVVIRRLIPDRAACWSSFYWAATLGMLSQLKFTYAMLAGMGIALAAGAALWRGRGRQAVAVLLGFFLAFVAAWLAAGQSLQNLSAYLRTSREIVAGYDGMAVDEATKDFLLGLFVSLFGALGIARLGGIFATKVERIAISLFLALVAFGAWKHGFTRADSWHITGFLLIWFCLAIVLPGYDTERRSLGSWAVCGMICLVGLLTGPWNLPEKARQVPARWQANLSALVNADKIPAQWEEDLTDVRSRLVLPELPKTLGAGSIDAYNFNQAELVLRPVNFVPRPVFQGYFAFTAELARWNRQHYESAQAPQFVLWRQFTIDGRFPTQDDAGLFPFIRQHYQIVDAAKSCVLLKRIPAPETDATATDLILRRTLSLGEDCTLPPSSGKTILWIRAEAKPTFLGRIRALIYKPALIYLNTTDAFHGRRRWRILPRVAGGNGFLLQPLLGNLSDFTGFMENRDLPEVRRISFDAPDGQENFWSTVEIEITTGPAPFPPL